MRGLDSEVPENRTEPGCRAAQLPEALDLIIDPVCGRLGDLDSELSQPIGC